MLLWVRSTVSQLVRRTVAVGLLFGVLVAPLETLLPDMHDVAPGAVAAAVTTPDPTVGQTDSFASHVESEHACNADTNGDACPQGQSGGTGYDHCTHSHVAHVVHPAARRSLSAVKYAAYTQSERLPASFRASPDIRPPIA